MLHTNIVRRQDQYITNSPDCALKEKPKKFWSYIKSKKQNQIGIPPLNGNGKVLTDSTSKAEVLSNRRFQQIFTKEDLSSIPSIGCSVIPAMESVILNREGIINLLTNLDSKKAKGPDKLPTTLLKITASEIAEAVTFLFSQSYESGQLPNDWRNAHVVPGFKKGKNMIPVIIDLSPLLLCYVKSWNISFIGTLCTILRTMTSYLRTNMDFGKIIHVNLS